jgi:hypothetical protein
LLLQWKHVVGIIELHVIANDINILIVAQQSSMVNLCHQQQRNIHTSSCEVHVIFVSVYPNLDFPKSSVFRSTEIHPVGALLTHADSWTVR